MPSRHAILGPSSAYRWLVCHPSARFEEQIEEEDSIYSREGTLAHDLAALILSARAGLLPKKYNFNAELKRIETEVINFYDEISHGDADSEAEFNVMYEAAEEWATVITDMGGTIHVEIEYDLSDYVPVSFGTSDATAENKTVLFINDYKYGAGVAVNPIKNKQLMLYGLGALLLNQKKGRQIKTVVLGIFQPRAGGYSSWEISAEKLIEWAETEVKPAALIAISGGGEFKPGPHCQFCKARTRCAAFYDKFARLQNLSDKRVMTDDQRAEVLLFGSVLSSWVKKVEERAVSDLQRGLPVPGFKLVKGRGNRSFKNEDNVVDILIGEGMETDGIFKLTLKGITELETALGKAKFKKLFADEIITREGAPKLAAGDDPREALDRSAADEYEDEDEEDDLL